MRAQRRPQPDGRRTPREIGQGSRERSIRRKHAGRGDQPRVVQAMQEVGVDLSKAYPKPLTDEFVRASDVVITMGCGDACPIYPGKRYEDWELDDPAGKTLEEVRPIRDELDRRIRVLLAELLDD